MEPEKTLLQQIREKEQEYAIKIEEVKKETALTVEAAKSEAEAGLCTVDAAARKEAEQIYWEGKGTIEAEIDGLKQKAAAERDAAARAGEQNQGRAIEAITRYVTMN